MLLCNCCIKNVYRIGLKTLPKIPLFKNFYHSQSLTCTPPFSLPVLVSGAAEAAAAAVPAAVAFAASIIAPAPRLAPALHCGGGGGNPNHNTGARVNVDVSTTLPARHPYPTGVKVDSGVGFGHGVSASLECQVCSTSPSPYPDCIPPTSPAPPRASPVNLDVWTTIPRACSPKPHPAHHEGPR